MEEDIPTTIASMKKKPTDASVQMNACRRLADLAFSNAVNKAAIAQAGGIPAVVAALRGHPTSAGVQEWGAAALAKLGAGELAPHAEATNSCFTRF